MNMINEQIEDQIDKLKIASETNKNNYIAFLLNQAAQIIESLSAKLQVTNMGNGSGWIACEDRLPEESFGCLVTIIDTNPVTLEDFENILPYHAGYDGNQWNNSEGEQVPFDVIAWQPLPEPYHQ